MCSSADWKACWEGRFSGSRTKVNRNNFEAATEARIKKSRKIQDKEKPSCVNLKKPWKGSAHLKCAAEYS